MSALALSTSNSATMLRRSLLHGVRYPLMLVSGLLTPVILLLLFVYILGGALGATMPDGRMGYLNYIAPSMVLLTVCYGGGATAVTVSVDMTEGIINRFRTMPISRASLLIGHVIGGVLRTMVSVLLVLAVALLMGFRPSATPVEWVATLGVLTMLAFALTWLTVALGASAKSPAGANTAILPIQLLPLVSSAFVPTDSMPGVIRWIAEYQPFTPVIDTVRGLLIGSPIGNSALIAAIWCVGITVVSFFWARAGFNRDA
ncbi:ABC-2 type transport system permease protein [Lentzea xinjiangensis]|uniref:Transport permease protein n=1 Tax=Lentzea xinjiangensis TaxID=402600 RepID=A0A1H9SWT8_9PSEU|nr:ABC transporter permease [Lentzea xinjiangensis]SER89381.1 ABC-2 type transport system permease protein [Lentzea xinjiangensis]